MGVGNSQSSGKRFLSISGGEVREKVKEGTPGAEYREYELPNGEKGGKWEKPFGYVDGLVSKVYFEDTDFGTMMKIDIDEFTLSLSTSSKYFSKLAERLPNVDFKKVVKFTPYDFTGDGGKKLTGISVKQGEEKLNSHFYDPDATGRERNINGIPVAEDFLETFGYSKDDIPKEVFQSDDWSFFFSKVKSFLIKYIKENVVPAVEAAGNKPPEASGRPAESPTEYSESMSGEQPVTPAGTSEDDIPF